MGPIPIFISYHIWLVVSTPLKNMRVSWDDYSQYMEIYKSCSKPPTRKISHYPISESQTNICQNFPTRYGTEVPQCLSLAGIRATGAAGGRGIHRHFAKRRRGFFLGVQSSRTGRFNHQKIYGFMVLGCYGAIMIYHDLTWFNQQKCWFNGDLRYGCSDLTRKKKHVKFHVIFSGGTMVINQWLTFGTSMGLQPIQTYPDWCFWIPNFLCFWKTWDLDGFGDIAVFFAYFETISCIVPRCEDECCVSWTEPTPRLWWLLATWQNIYEAEPNSAILNRGRVPNSQINQRWSQYIYIFVYIYTYKYIYIYIS